MPSKHHVLFVQGGGKGAHDEWDNHLVEDLRQRLGRDFEIGYPRMPNEQSPNYSAWKGALEKALAPLPIGTILIGHSVGGTFLLKALTDHIASKKPGGIFLLAAPFVGDGGWPADELEFPENFAEHLPRSVPIRFFHGLSDETAPPKHADLYARAVPQAHVHRLPARDHQLNNDMSEVAAAITALEK